MRTFGRACISVFYIFSLTSFFGWFYSFVARELGCSYALFCRGDQKLLSFTFRFFGDHLALLYSMLWNTPFMPHSSRTYHPDGIAMILNSVILAIGIAMFRKVKKST